jgi:exodeoxyribonuclease VIII
MKANGIVLSKTEVMFTTFLGDILVKCAIDGISDDGYIYDLKTCEDASPQGFLQAVRKYRYNLQAYFYRHAVESAFKCRVLGFRFIAVEKEPPYATAVYELGPELMTNAAFDFERVVRLYKDCTASGEWPGYQKEITTIDLAAKPSAATNISFA